MFLVTIGESVSVGVTLMISSYVLVDNSPSPSLTFSGILSTLTLLLSTLGGLQILSNYIYIEEFNKYGQGKAK